VNTPKESSKINDYLLTMAQVRNQELLNSVGATIRLIRERKGLTLEALANASELEISQVHRVETGKANSSISTLDAIAKGLDIPLADLFKKQ